MFFAPCRIADLLSGREPAAPESNLVNYRIEDGFMEVFHRTPGAQRGSVPTLFAGGGSSLFQRELLRRFIGTRDPYSPFYFEDAEWSVGEHQKGIEYFSVRAPLARHLHRATVLKFYAPEEVDRLLSNFRPPL